MIDSNTQDPTNKIKYCECGCGELAPIAKVTRRARGQVKGQPIRFIQRHNGNRRPVAERFWEKVDKRGPDECWFWTAAIRNGYGVLGMDGRIVYAHRLSYELHYGPIPDGLHVLHNCPGGDRRACVNPKHLWLGTTQENTADKVTKGGQPRGIKVASAKLTPEKVRRIRELLEIGMSRKNIAARFGVSQSHVGNIVRGETWKHVK